MEIVKCALRFIKNYIILPVSAADKNGFKKRLQNSNLHHIISHRVNVNNNNYTLAKQLYSSESKHKQVYIHTEPVNHITL